MNMLKVMKLNMFPALKEIFPESCVAKPNLDCKYTFSIDLAPNGIHFGAKSIGKVQLQSKFGLDTHYSGNISLRGVTRNTITQKSCNDLFLSETSTFDITLLFNVIIDICLILPGLIRTVLMNPN